MYLVKALAQAFMPVSPGGDDVEFSANTCRLVDDSLIAKYQAHPTVFTVLAGPDDSDAIAAAAGQTALDAAGTKNGSTVSVSESSGVVNKTVLTMTATPVTITDEGGVAQYGGAGKIYDFPEGLIVVLGATIDGAVTLGATGTITSTWGGGVALGTATATTGATLTGTEADIMAENNVAAATASVAACDAATSAVAVLNGTGGAKACYLNLVVDDHASHTSGTGTFTGTVTLLWTKVADTA